MAFVDRLVRVGVRLGREIDGVRELEVSGRRTGRPRRVPVKVLLVGGELHVVALQGETQWSRNLRSAGAARLRFGRSIEEVDATELHGDERLPVLQAYREAATRAEVAPGAAVFRLRARTGADARSS